MSLGGAALAGVAGAALYGVAACRVTRPLLWDRFHPHVHWRGPRRVPGPLEDGGRRAIALTFDDGPHPDNTPAILDLLSAHGARATFFLLGREAERHPALVKRIRREGHEIGNHSWGHRKLPLLSSREIASEIDRGAAAIERAGGGATRLFRPPHGLRDPRVLRITRERGYRVILWSVMPWDWTRPPASLIAGWVGARAGGGDIVVLHDGGGDRRPTVEALERLLPRLAERRLETVTISRLIGPVQ